MALPYSSEARRYYQAARQRFDDAEFLLNADRTTGAMYLAGYSVECMFKALILSVVSRQKRAEMVATFRGAKAHDFDWLKVRYFENGGPPFPPHVSKSLVYVQPWATEIRYRSGTTNRRDAESFLRAVKTIMTWADGRL